MARLLSRGIRSRIKGERCSDLHRRSAGHKFGHNDHRKDRTMTTNRARQVPGLDYAQVSGLTTEQVVARLDTEGQRNRDREAAELAATVSAVQAARPASVTERSDDSAPDRAPATRPPSAAEVQPWQRPPFPEGHTVTLRHGARSPRVYGDLARHLATGLTEDRPDLERFPEAVAAWATAEAQATLLRRHLDLVGTLDENGLPREGLLVWLKNFETRAEKARATLGLDPRSEATLARERTAAALHTVDLAALAERGAEALAQRPTTGPDPAALALERVQAEGAEALRRQADKLRDRGDDDR